MVKQQFHIDRSSKFLLRWIFSCLTAIIFTTATWDWFRTNDLIYLNTGFIITPILLGILIAITIQVALDTLMSRRKKTHV